MPTLNKTRGKGFLRDCVAMKGGFLTLGVVGIMGICLDELSEMHVYFWLIFVNPKNPSMRST